ncbi:MAG: SMI1/KNR4 family protein [Oscillospiraceae bacterium]
MENQIEGIKSKLEDKDIKLNQPLPMEKIINFENEYNIKLPKELVAFYTQISNGAMLYPNEDICNLYSFEDWIFNKMSIQKDFTLKNNICNYDFSQQENNIFFKKISYGNIELMDLGCGGSYNIIVKGNRYGEMFSYLDPCLEFSNKKFLDWFESCLDGKDEYML